MSQDPRNVSQGMTGISKLFQLVAAAPCDKIATWEARWAARRPIDGLRQVTPCTQRIDRLIDLLEQIRDGGRPGTGRR